MLYIPKFGQSFSEDNQATTSAEYGTSVAAGSSAHTKNTTYTQLIAATGRDIWGLFISVYNTAIASTRVNVLVDIAIGAASSEQVIIPNLMAGNVAASGIAQGYDNMYFFPIFIPAGVRLSATAQASTASDTVNVLLHCLEYPMVGQWYGTRVKDYGTALANSTGTSMSPANNAYATPVTLAASTTNPIKYMQVGTDLFTNAAGTNLRGLIKISQGNDAPVLVQDLPYSESTTVESINFALANFVLSHMRWNLPSGIDLRISAMRNAAAATRGWIIYGMD